MNLITITRRVSPFRLIERVEEGDVSPSTVSQNVQPFEERGYRSKRGEGEREREEERGHGCKRLGFVTGEPFFTTWFVVNETCTICNQIDGASTMWINQCFSICCINIVWPREAGKSRHRLVYRTWTWSTDRGGGGGGGGRGTKEGRGMKNRAKNNGNVVSPRSTLSDAKKEKSGCRRGWGK